MINPIPPTTRRVCIFLCILGTFTLFPNNSPTYFQFPFSNHAWNRRYKNVPIWEHWKLPYIIAYKITNFKGLDNYQYKSIGNLKIKCNMKIPTKGNQMFPFGNTGHILYRINAKKNNTFSIKQPLFTDQWCHIIINHIIKSL